MKDSSIPEMGIPFCIQKKKRGICGISELIFSWTRIKILYSG
jgi:hypothetical protein